MLTWYLWGHQEVPWGYEVRVDASDEAGTRYPICMTWFSGDPGQEAIEAEAKRRVERMAAGLLESPHEPETIYAEHEVLEILVQKGYLEPGQTLSDLPQKGAA